MKGPVSFLYLSFSLMKSLVKNFILKVGIAVLKGYFMKKRKKSQVIRV